jgi:hypothetical protein
VWLGDIPCDAAEQVNASIITCTTAHPTGGNASLPKPQGPQPVRVVFSDWGNAACNATARAGSASAASCAYQFVDLWSRKTTWGGGEPPTEGDTVMIPGQWVEMHEHHTQCLKTPAHATVAAAGLVAHAFACTAWCADIALYL